MGFCRRCGDIVSGERCKCGGLAVRPSVDFSQTTSNATQPDLWFRTYVRSTNKMSSPSRERSTTLSGSTLRPLTDTPKRARTQSTYFSRSTLSDPILSHIESTLAHDSQSSVVTGSSRRDDTGDSVSDDILSDPNTSTLAKAYGSVLQPKETLSVFACMACAIPFSPDATIYPDPKEPTTTTQFLCKPCFMTNGGTKGNCASCGKSVLILTSEGGFIENAGRLWHRRCFRCDGCFKDISDKPMVDLLGRPSCESCFDTCLKRPRTDSVGCRRAIGTPEKQEGRSNPGGMMRGTSREASPAIEELQQRLGIRSQESSPLVDRKRTNSSDCGSSPGSPALTRRLSELSMRATSNPSPKDISAGDALIQTPDTSPSPKGRYARFRLSSSGASPKALNIHSPFPKAENNAIQDIERRLQQRSLTVSSSTTLLSPTTSSRESLSGVLCTPDLTDSSSCSAISSPPSTPFNSSPEQREASFEKTPTKPAAEQTDGCSAKLVPSSPSTPCAKCLIPLFRTKSGGKFVTVPEESSKCLPPKSYHVECFRCAVCEEPFQETKNGQAVFVRTSTGCCHIGCATPERIIIRPIRTKSSSVSLASSPAKQDRPPATAPSTINSFRRFGSTVTCPGCHISVSPMEHGVVPGPQGSRWHASCLVCGGKGTIAGPRRDPNTPGCGKRLDSAAKTDGEGGVWCRECLLLLDPSSKQDSVKRLESSFTGGNGFCSLPPTGTRKNEVTTSHFTGTTTIARQFTGMSVLTSQLTGSGLNPTRQLLKDLNRSPSPTKGFILGRINEGRRLPFPRPKSAGGLRGRSVDEGRGMFLVHQLTGNRDGESGQ